MPPRWRVKNVGVRTSNLEPPPNIFGGKATSIVRRLQEAIQFAGSPSKGKDKLGAQTE